MSTYIHNLDPFAFQFSGSFGIRWYGLAYLAGFLSGYLLTHWLKRRSKIELKNEDISDFIFYSALGAVIGGRLGYCTMYRPELLTTFSAGFPFWGVFAVHEGGMASHGGILGVIIAGVIFCKIRKVSFLHILDLTTFGGAIGICLGRLANFVNGELVGRVCEPIRSFCVRFPSDILTFPRYKLEELGPAVSELGISAERWKGMLNLESRQTIENVLHQLLFQIQSGNEIVRVLVGEVLDPRHPSQLYAALFEGLIVFLVLFFVWAKPRKPGIIASLFLMVYAAGRIFDEQFRLPDAHLGFQLFDLTRGQWLSIGTLVLGIAFFFAARARNSEKLGGWYVRSLKSES